MLKKIILMLFIFSNLSIYSAEASKNMTRNVFILNGASCSGKSTIAQTLKTVTPYFANKWAFVSQDDEDLDDYAPIKNNILESFDHRAMISKILMSQANNICCDIVLYNNSEIEEFIKILKENGFNPIIILVDCPKSVLQCRAHSRSLSRNSSEGETATANKALDDWKELHEIEESGLITPTSSSGRKFSIPEESQEDLELALIQHNSFIPKPKYKFYNLIIDTSYEKTEDSIRKILNFINK